MCYITDNAYENKHVSLFRIVNLFIIIEKVYFVNISIPDDKFPFLFKLKLKNAIFPLIKVRKYFSAFRENVKNSISC
jgi:hypothetical protein